MSAYPALRMAVRTFWKAVVMRARTFATFAEVKLEVTEESSLQ